MDYLCLVYGEEKAVRAGGARAVAPQGARTASDL
jgi:hypothetical protein